MSKPQFTLWPYRVLALLVPLLAVGAAVLTGTNSKHAIGDDWSGEWMSVFGTVLGAGNGYILALACGDLRRAVLALLIGVVAGFSAITLLSLPAATFLFGGVLLSLMYAALEKKQVPEVSGGGAIILLIITIMWAGLASFDPYSRRALAVPFALPFVCGAARIVAAEKLANHEILAAIQNGCNASVIGILYATPLILFTAVLPIRTDPVILILFVSACLLIANYFFVLETFSSLHRTPQAVKI